MAKPASEPAPTFPYWPFSCMNFYSRVARDLSGCAEAVTHAEDGAQALHAEADYGVSLYHDLMKGYYELALMPFTAMAGILGARTGPAAADLVQAEPAQAGLAKAPPTKAARA